VFFAAISQNPPMSGTPPGIVEAIAGHASEFAKRTVVLQVLRRFLRANVFTLILGLGSVLNAAIANAHNSGGERPGNVSRHVHRNGGNFGGNFRP